MVVKAETDRTPRQRGGHIDDDRGKTVTQYDPVSMYLLRRHDAGIPEDVLRELTHRIGIGKLADSRLGLLGGIVAFACTLLLLGGSILLFIQGQISSTEFAWRAVLYQGIWITPLVFWRTARRNRFHRIRQAMLDYRRCPHCGYDIRGLPTDAADGTTVCPECGCAWRLTDSIAPGSRGPRL